MGQQSICKSNRFFNTKKIKSKISYIILLLFKLFCYLEYNFHNVSVVDDA